MDTTIQTNTAKERAMQALQAWRSDESGVTAIEYGLLAALIAVAIIGGVSATGISLGDLYTKWSNAVVAAITGS